MISRPNLVGGEAGHFSGSGVAEVHRRARADALHASIAEQVEALTDIEEWEKVLAFARAFHACSLNLALSC